MISPPAGLSPSTRLMRRGRASVSPASNRSASSMACLPFLPRSLPPGAPHPYYLLPRPSQRALSQAVDDELAALHRQGSVLLRQLLGQGVDGGLQLRFGHHLVDEPPHLRTLCRDL